MANVTGRPIAPARKLVAAVLGTIAVFVMVFGLGMSSWAIVALGAALLALAIAFGMVNVARRGARAWIAGQGQVKAVSDPSGTAAYGRAELQLVVVAPGLPVTEVLVRDPRVPVSKWPLVGDTVPLTVDVDDMRRVRIDWDQTPDRDDDGDPPPPNAYDQPDEYLDDDLLGEPEPPPWATRDSEWGRGPDEPPPPPPPGADADLLTSSVVVHDTPAGPILEGQLVDPDAPPPLPRRPRQDRSEVLSDFPAAAGPSAAGDFAAAPPASAYPSAAEDSPFAPGPVTTEPAYVTETVQTEPAPPYADPPPPPSPGAARAPRTRPSPHRPRPHPGAATATVAPETDSDTPDSAPTAAPQHADPQAGPIPGQRAAGVPGSDPAASPDTRTDTTPDPEIDLPLDDDPEDSPEARSARADGLIAPPAASPSQPADHTPADEPSDPPPAAESPREQSRSTITGVDARPPTKPDPETTPDDALTSEGTDATGHHPTEPQNDRASVATAHQPSNSPTASATTDQADDDPTRATAQSGNSPTTAATTDQPDDVPTPATAAPQPSDTPTAAGATGPSAGASSATAPEANRPGPLRSAAAAAGAAIVGAAAGLAARALNRDDATRSPERTGPAPAPAQRTAQAAPPTAGSHAVTPGNAAAAASSDTPADEHQNAAATTGQPDPAAAAGPAATATAEAPVATSDPGSTTEPADPAAASTGASGAPAATGTDAAQGRPWADLENGGYEPDERADDLITAYPSARPGPAGAIHGIGITVLVTDLARSTAFYRDTLGFFEIDHGPGSAILASGDTRLVLRAVPGRSADTGRLVHLNLEVGDVEAVHDELAAKGVAFEHAPRPVDRGDRLELWAATFADPDGHTIAITQWRAVR